MKFRHALYLMILLTVASCTTLRSPRQRMKVVTEPPGADIYFEGNKVGSTPAFIEVRRARQAHLEIEKPGYLSARTDLSSGYRWRDSFISNLIWINLAPVGWATDLISQTAWDYETTGPIRLTPETPPVPTNVSTPKLDPREIMGKVAIAPPQNEHELLSDEAGERLERWARSRYPKAEILKFENTQMTFADFAYVHDNVVSPKFRDEMAYKLGASYILETRLTEVESQKVLVDTSLHDVFYDRVIDRTEQEVMPRDLSYQKRSAFSRAVLKYASFLPNAITFDTSSPNAAIWAGSPENQIATSPYHSVSNKPPTVWSTIAGIGVRSLRGPELFQPLTVELRFVPTASVYYDQFRFDSSQATNEFAEMTFQWYTFQLGYGPELDFVFPVGIFYVNALPALGVDWIAYSRGGTSKSLTKSNFHIESEAGFSFFLSRNFNLRFYGRTLATGLDTWQEVLTEAAGRKITIQSATQTMVGFSFGYYFPEARSGVKRWFR